MKVPSYVLLPKNDKLKYWVRLTPGKVYKVTGLDRREGSDSDTLLLSDDQGGVSAVALEDVVVLASETLKLVRILFE